MGRRFMIKEKENNLIPDNRQNEDRSEESRRMQDVLLLQKVRERMLQNQRNIEKLSENLRLLKRCAINCLDWVETTVDTMEQQQLETEKIVQIIEQDDLLSSNSSKRHAVNPMVAGFTLKRARISLKRLAPNQQLQRRGTSSNLRVAENSVTESISDVALNSTSDSEFSSSDELSSNNSEL